MMRLPQKMRRGILAIFMCVAVLATMPPSVALAAEPHEDTETATEVFSGISLFRYYAASLDSVLKKAPEDVEARLEKMPFAHIPLSLEQVTANFTSAGISLSYLVVAIGEDMQEISALMGEFRLDEAADLGNQIRTTLLSAHSELEHIEQATVLTGQELGAISAPSGSDLRHSYNEVLERINRIRQMLALYEELLKSLEESLDSDDITSEALTDITLKIYPTVSYIGDSIHFWGILTSHGESLAGREIDILVDNLQYITVKTGTGGYYHGRLRVPYWYLSEMNLQALYYPRDRDVGVYLASLSSVKKLKTRFHEADLKISADDKTYPGLTTTISVRFDYGQSPPPKARNIEIYLDDVLIAQRIAREAFNHSIRIHPEADIGQYVITVSAAARGKYSPVVASTILDVTRATPVLSLDIPAVAIIPGSIELSGKLHSEVGPLRGSAFQMQMGESQVKLTSSEDGTFDTKIRAGMAFGLLGWRDLKIDGVPEEPWHAPFSTTRRLFTINIINCAIFGAIIVFLGIYLPGRLRKRLGVSAPRTARPVVTTAPPDPAPAYSQVVTAAASVEESNEASGEPRNRILYWYRRAVRLLAGITKLLLGPQQTLREFAYANSKILGPGAKYFIKLTKMVERLLYSQYQPTEEDTQQSQQLSRTIEEGLKGEGI